MFALLDSIGRGHANNLVLFAVQRGGSHSESHLMFTLQRLFLCDMTPKFYSTKSQTADTQRM